MTSNFVFQIEQFLIRIFIDTHFITKVRWQKHQKFISYFGSKRKASSENETNTEKKSKPSE